MQLELKRIAPLRAANMVAVIYFVLFAIFGLGFLPFAFWAPGNAQLDPQQQALARSLLGGVLLLYPILGAITGWLGTLTATGLYNLVAPRVGGFLLEFGEHDGVRGPAA